MTSSQSRRVLQPRQGRLRTKIAPAVGQPAAGELKRRIAAQDIEIVGVLVAAADREDAGPDHVGDRMGDARGIAPIGNAARQTLATPNRRSAIESSITPPSEDIRPPSKAAVTFLPWTAGNENSGIVSSVMAAVAGAKARKGLVLATKSYAIPEA